MSSLGSKGVLFVFRLFSIAIENLSIYIRKIIIVDFQLFCEKKKIFFYIIFLVSICCFPYVPTATMLVFGCDSAQR